MDGHCSCARMSAAPHRGAWSPTSAEHVDGDSSFAYRGNPGRVFRPACDVGGHTAADRGERLAAITDVVTPRYHAPRLLVAERGSQYAPFVQTLDAFIGATPDGLTARTSDLVTAAEGILRGERAAIAVDPGDVCPPRPDKQNRCRGNLSGGETGIRRVSLNLRPCDC